MNDTGKEGGGHEPDETGSGENQGFRKQAEDGAGGDGPRDYQRPGNPGGGSGEDECPGQGGDPYFLFRDQVLQAVRVEPEATVKVELVKLINEEGQRNLEIQKEELANGLGQLKEQFKAKAQTFKAENRAEFWSGFLGDVQKFGNWIAAVGFVFFLASWMIYFYNHGQTTTGDHLKDILMVMIGGALGWIGKELASRNNGGDREQG
jgi:hypothetical protein